MRVSVVDIAVIVILGLSLFSFSTKYQPKYEFEYSGSQIYKMVQECEIQDATGFLYTVFVKGYWNADIGHFEQEGFVTDTGRGYFEMVLHDGRIISVGGKQSYREDIQAVDITLQLKSKSSVFYVLKPFKGSTSEVRARIEASSSFITYPQEDTAISCVLTVEADAAPDITLEAEVEDTLRKAIFYMKKADVVLQENGMTITVERLSMKDFDTLFDILEQYFSIGSVFTGDIEVVYQTAEEIEVEDVPVLESYQDEHIYPGSVHVRV
ncbi:MAG: hypothetical protein HXS41_12145 [Theionarchaea archaeon]|nr:hypothetical protein [Theionarchaea archaeon]MBU6999342.1 hypothetical protein [Theionarchaea archaeon]MBU7021802.1 hypothetical protein [Theionarchaea archaeon]MBU7034132.1 hypothetical protein [Theionarchaea archaeon]MBU7040031.1 hypothetical protein [Theionarchaea archaeon]